ncbi:MAG: 2-oxo acid dehydrogenase subunit E2 [Spirochaetes bacterium]|nr:2-oxo acid dehydrogenase subunit E2 [Spirochaetota bacterium]
MATEVLMPRQGQTVESCVILEWKKKEGEKVQKGDILCEVETDKAVFSVEAPTDGILLKVLFSEGADVPVLTPIAYIGEAGEQLPGTPDKSPPPISSKEQQTMQTASTTSQDPGLQYQSSAPDRKPLRISPRAMRLARQNGIQPEILVGTGPKGRIIERDVRRAIEEKQQSLRSISEEAARLSTSWEPSQTTTPVMGETKEGGISVPVTGTRKVISQRMMESLQSHAQYTLHAIADARALLRWRKRFKEAPEAYGYQDITINDLILFVVAKTLPRFPELNAYWLKDTIQRFSTVHLGVAVDTPKGLLVPVIRNAQTLSLAALSREAKRLAQACMEGKISTDDLSGGTFTVTNLGSFGIQYFTPILNAPQVAILGVGTIQPQPVMEGEEVKFYPHIGLSLTVDHQAVDGAPASRFLKALVEATANIDLLFAGS